jgi:hypothetical protein
MRTPVKPISEDTKSGIGTNVATASPSAVETAIIVKANAIRSMRVSR